MGVLDAIAGGAKKAKEKASGVKTAAKRTEVKDKFFGGKEVEKTVVKKKGNRTRVDTTTTETSPTGRHKKTVHKSSGDRL